jgi:hypothetical protein
MYILLTEKIKNVGWGPRHGARTHAQICVCAHHTHTCTQTCTLNNITVTLFQVGYMYMTNHKFVWWYSLCLVWKC